MCHRIIEVLTYHIGDNYNPGEDKLGFYLFEKIALIKPHKQCPQWRPGWFQNRFAALVVACCACAHYDLCDEKFCLY